MSTERMTAVESVPIGAITLGQKYLSENDIANNAPDGATCYRRVPHETKDSNGNGKVLVEYYSLPE
jgi:hypothetical protein